MPYLPYVMQYSGRARNFNPGFGNHVGTSDLVYIKGVNAKTGEKKLART